MAQRDLGDDGTAADGCASFQGSFSELKERQLVFLLVRQLADAQFVRADRAGSERLWQEAAALEIDPDRIMALLYGAADLGDTESMERIDRTHRRPAPRPRRSWLDAGGLRGVSDRRSGAWHRTAPPATPPARPAAR